MIYKFKIWAWKPVCCEINLSALTDEEALRTFKALDLNSFQWKRDQMLHNRTTYEVIKIDETTKDSTIISK